MVPGHIQHTTSEGQSWIVQHWKWSASLGRVTSEIQWQLLTIHLNLWLSSQPALPFSSEREQQQPRNERETNLLSEPWVLPNCYITERPSLTVCRDGCVIMHFSIDIKPSLTWSITLELPSRVFPQYIKFLT